MYEVKLNNDKRNGQIYILAEISNFSIKNR